MGGLSEHFSKKEFECPCCHQVIINKKLIEKLEKVRTAIGNNPINITSGYRCKKYNTSIDGDINSPHLVGLAADTQCKYSIIDYALMASKVGGIRLGIYPNHLHIDIIEPHPSKFWLVKKYGGKYIYSKYENDLKSFLKGVIGNVID